MEAIINLLLSPQDREATIQLRRATSAEWAADNPVLLEGEVGIDTTTGLIKVGNGTDPWASLQLQARYLTSVTSTATDIGATPAAVKTAYDQAVTATANAATAQAAAENAAATSIPRAMVTAKGDIIAATANGVPDNLPVGENNAVLTADSSAATGVKWASADEYMAYIFFN
jgi:hypothetical protein